MKYGMLGLVSRLRPADGSKPSSLQRIDVSGLSNSSISDGWEQMLQIGLKMSQLVSSTMRWIGKRRASEWMA